MICGLFFLSHFDLCSSKHLALPFNARSHQLDPQRIRFCPTLPRGQLEEIGWRACLVAWSLGCKRVRHDGAAANHNLVETCRGLDDGAKCKSSISRSLASFRTTGNLIDWR